MRQIRYFLVVIIMLSVVGSTSAARIGVPFQRYSTGLPGNDSEVWNWDPNGETPEGQVPCAGNGHTAAIAQATVSGWIVNNQFSIGLDNGASASITAYLVRVRNGVLTIIDQATIPHPAAGFSITNGGMQNRFRVLQTAQAFSLATKLVSS